MLTAVAIIPSAPVLVPQLAGTAGTELAALQSAVARCVAELPERWLVLGVGASDVVLGPRSCGSFGGYGADVVVTLSPEATDEIAELPLCALIAGWVRGRYAADSSAEVHCVASALGNDDAVDMGRRLRSALDDDADPVGILVVADGMHTLTASAPGGYDPDSVVVQQELDNALAGGDIAVLSRLPDGPVGRAAFAVLAGLCPRPRATREYYRGAPYGVGYFAGVWQCDR